MTIVLGLDVSTSVTGICVVDSEAMPDEQGSQILLLDRIEFKGCGTLWEKADAVAVRLRELDGDHAALGSRRIGRVVVEEPLMGFRTGMSSAQTITQLMRFNGIVSYIARSQLGCEPEYIGSAHARKLCGMKMQRTAAAGMSQKEQVFKHMKEHDLKHVVWDRKKNGAEVDWSRDATDAYVIARAAVVQGTASVPAPKVRKSKNKAP
jgi:hypothetical protein